MIGKTHPLIKNYIKEISRQIPKDYPNKAKILKNMKQDLQNRMQESPPESWNTILDDFGTPAENLEFLISEYSGNDISNTLQTKKNQTLFLFTICILFSFFAFCSLGYMYYQENFQKHFINEPQYIFKNGIAVPLEKMQDD